MGDSAVTKCENVGMNEKGGIAWVRIQLDNDGPIPLPLSVMVIDKRIQRGSFVNVCLTVNFSGRTTSTQCW
jgi:hypothetical protein